MDLINAQDTDPRDPNFAALPLVIAWHPHGTAASVRTAKLYAPAAEAVRWDGAPAITNVAIGHRYGFAYATVELVARQATRIPGTGEYGYRVALRWHNHDFDRGYETTEKREAWIFARGEDGWRSRDEIAEALPPAPRAMLTAEGALAAV